MAGRLSLGKTECGFPVRVCTASLSGSLPLDVDTPQVHAHAGHGVLRDCTGKTNCGLLHAPIQGCCNQAASHICGYLMAYHVFVQAKFKSMSNVPHLSVLLPACLQDTDEGKVLYQAKLRQVISDLQSEYNTLM